MNPVEALLSVILLCTNGAVCQSYPIVEPETHMNAVYINMCAEGEDLKDLQMEEDPDAVKMIRFENPQTNKAFVITILQCKQE